jgi:cobalt-zinc-cadmium efflux system protein
MEHRHDGEGAGGLMPHAHGASVAERRVLWASLVTGGFMLAEVAGGLLAGSLALLADAGHMLTDVGALALAYAGMRFARRPADPQRSFGYQRLEVLAAFVNGIALLVLSAWILVEAATRLVEPVEVLGGTMLVIAVLGLAVNVGSFLILRGSAHTNINIRGALVHVIGDLLGSVATVAAALVIYFLQWTPIDPILSALVAVLIIRSGWDITRRAGHILLEGTPENIPGEELRRALAGLAGVERIFHIHVWSLTSGRPLATLHVRLQPGADADAVRLAVKSRLREKFGIEHSTVETERMPPPAS